MTSIISTSLTVPSAIVIVATIRSLKYNGGVELKNLSEPNLEALRNGSVNLQKHIENMQQFGVPVLVTVNKFYTDTQEEIDYLVKMCEELGVKCSVSEVFAKGGNGGIELANHVIETLNTKESNYQPIYDERLSIKEKIETVAKKIYGADGVEYTEEAEIQIKNLEELKLEKITFSL